MTRRPSPLMDIEPLLNELRLLMGNGLRYLEDPWEEEHWKRVQKLVYEYSGKTRTATVS